MVESPEVRRLARELAQLKHAVRAMQTSPQMGFVSLDDASINAYDAAGTLMQTIGRQRDGTFASVTRDGPVPPVPSAPSEVVGGPGGIAATWDGTFVDDADAPGDFAAVEVWAAETDFTDVEDARLVAPIASAAGGQGAGRLTVGTWHVALVTRAQSGKRSAPSERVVVEVESVVDQAIIDELNEKLDGMPSITWDAAAPTLADGDGKPEGAVWRQVTDGKIVGEWEWTGTAWEARPIADDAIASLDVGKLTASTAEIAEAVITKLWVDLFAANKVTAAEIDVQDLWADTAFLGELNSATITGATIRTAASGMRVELDSAHMLQIFNADEDRVLWADALGNLVLGGDIRLTGGITTETAASRLEITSGELRLTPKGYLDEQAAYPWDLPGSIYTYPLPADVVALDVSGQYLFLPDGQGVNLLRIDLDTGQATDTWTLPYPTAGPTCATRDGWVYWTARRGDGWAYRTSQTTGAHQAVCALPASAYAGGSYYNLLGVLDTGELVLRGGTGSRILYGVASSTGTLLAEWLGGNSPQSSIELYAGVNATYGHVYGCEQRAGGFIFTAWSSTGTLLQERAVSNRTTITVSEDGETVYLSERGVGQLTLLNGADLSTRTSWAAPALTTLWAQVSVSPDESTVWTFDYSEGITKSTVVSESELEGGGAPITITASGIHSPVRVRTGTVETGRIHNNDSQLNIELPITRSGPNIFDSTARRDAALNGPGGLTLPGIEATTVAGNDAPRRWIYESHQIEGWTDWAELALHRLGTLADRVLDLYVRPGVWFQPLASNATFGRQYPEEAVRGVLEVTSSGASNSLVVQTYTTIGTTSAPGNRYWRTRNTATSGWSPWVLIGGDTGWAPLGRTSGVGGSIEMSTRGGTVHVQVDVTGSFPAGDTLLSAGGAVPTGYRIRPTGFPTGIAYLDPGGSGLLYSNTAGDIRYARGVSGTTRIRGSLAWGAN